MISKNIVLEAFIYRKFINVRIEMFCGDIKPRAWPYADIKIKVDMHISKKFAEEGKNFSILSA